MGHLKSYKLIQNSSKEKDSTNVLQPALGAKTDPLNLKCIWNF